MAPPNYLTEGIVLAAIPAAGYWSAFLYELGYCAYFEIPSQLIDVTLNSALLNTMSVLVCMGAVVIFSDGMRERLANVHPSLKASIFKVAVGIFMILGVGVITKFNWMVVTLTGIVVGGQAFSELVVPLLTHRNISGYGNKVAAAKQQDFEFDSAFDLAAKKVGRGPMLALVAIYFISMFAYIVGGISASTQSTFATSEDMPERILVRNYGRNWIAMAYDRETGETLQDFKLATPETISGFKLESIGRLEPRELITVSQPAPIPTSTPDPNSPEIKPSQHLLPPL